MDSIINHTKGRLTFGDNSTSFTWNGSDKLTLVAGGLPLNHSYLNTDKDHISLVSVIAEYSFDIYHEIRIWYCGSPEARDVKVSIRISSKH